MLTPAVGSVLQRDRDEPTTAQKTTGEGAKHKRASATQSCSSAAPLPPPVTLFALLQRAAAGDGGVVFVDKREQSQRHTYAQLFVGAKLLAARLTAMGLRRGERVALILPTGPSFYHALFATQAVAAIAAPLYPPVRLARLDEYLTRTAAMLRRIDAALVVTTPELVGLLAPALRAHDARLGYLTLPAADCGGAGDTIDKGSASLTHNTTNNTISISGSNNGIKPNDNCSNAQSPDSEPFKDVACVDDVALLQFSSGTTADPKAVALTHAQVGANVASIARALYVGAPPRRSDGRHCTVSWLPLYHDMGLMGCVLTSLYDGSDVWLLAPESFIGRPAAWLRTIAKARASVSAAPNFAYALCTERIAEKDLADLDLSCWQVALNGAEGVSAATMAAFSQKFAPCGFAASALTPVYGLAEAVLAVSFAAPGEPFRARQFDACRLRREGRAVAVVGDACTTAPTTTLVSVGRPLPHYAVRIATDATQQASAAEGVVGELEIMGPSLMTGYWPIPATHTPPTNKRWLATGDLAVIVAGELYIVGRKKDVIVVRGQNYDPEEVERALDGAPLVRTGCSVAGSVPAAKGATEIVVALVELRKWPPGPEAADLPKRLAARVAQATSLRLDHVVLLAPGTLPRTSSGKKRRAHALALWQRDALTPPRKVVRWLLLLRACVGRLALRRRRHHCPQPTVAP